MAVSNTDDHLRNHGFLLTEYGWTLSPMYDVNPNIYGNTLSLGVSVNDSTIDFALAIETAEYYGLNVRDAGHIVVEMRKIIRDNWQALAVNYGLSKGAIARMKPAFTMIS